MPFCEGGDNRFVVVLVLLKMSTECAGSFCDQFLDLVSTFPSLLSFKYGILFPKRVFLPTLFPLL